MKGQIATVLILAGLLTGCGTYGSTASGIGTLPATTPEDMGRQFIRDVDTHDYSSAETLVTPNYRKWYKPTDLPLFVENGFDTTTVERIVLERKTNDFAIVTFGVKQNSSKAKGDFYNIITIPFLNTAGHWYIATNLETRSNASELQMTNLYVEQLDQDVNDTFIQNMQATDKVFETANPSFMKQVQQSMDEATKEQQDAQILAQKDQSSSSNGQ